MSRPPVFALIDCNNFFVSCERVFRPDLLNKPVVVLSSNDGCVVARSNEVKALGIRMAAPAFKYKEAFSQNHVVQFSANFELYGDISRRITEILTTVTPRIEIYSVDESFLDLSELNIPDYTEWGRRVREIIWRWVGIPVSIGIAPSKTLAKLASDFAKKAHNTCTASASHPAELAVQQKLVVPRGVSASSAPTAYQPYASVRASAPPSAASTCKHCGKPEGVLSFINMPTTEKGHVLSQVPVGDIWGIGWRLAPKMRAEGVRHAADMAGLRPQRAQQLMGIHGRQLVAELNGLACHPLELEGKVRKSIARTRTFGRDTNDLNSLEAAVTTFATKAAFRLRVSGQVTRRAGLFLTTNKHKPGYRVWSREIHYRVPTADTGQLIGSLIKELGGIYSPTHQYYRAGVWLDGFLPADALQTDLFGEVDVSAEVAARDRMQAIDTLNERYGRDTVRYASEDLGTKWRPRYNLRSPRYTTNLDELPLVRPW